MESLTIYQLRQRAEAHFEAVAQTEGIDQFCSSLDWILPAHEAFIPDHPLHLRASEDGFVALARGFNPRIGRYLQPLEASWCLASPFAGGDAPALVAGFHEECETRLVDWDLLYLSGIPPETELFRAIVREFGARHRIGLGHRTLRYVASLEGGTDAFLSRRSSKFRANLRRSGRLADDAGVEFDWIDSVDPEKCDQLYERILAVEERSWKGQSGTGILDGGMNTFYRIMLPRLARRDALRVVFARADDRDVAFVFGGLFEGTYRGLQLSYDDELSRLSLGNLVQLEMIERLCEEGVSRYDLGSELEYKARWAESRLETVTLWVWR
jgi:hypothetical protein